MIAVTAEFSFWQRFWKPGIILSALILSLPIFTILGYVPVALREDLPFTCSPEYEAANRAYMRYHNMNPIWGISSKQARAADGH